LDIGAPIIGGATRQESVRRGLDVIAAEDAPELILIHDAARPFCPPEVIDRLLAALDTSAGAVPVLPLPDTIFRANPSSLGETVARDDLVRVQTPQAFWFDAIHRAHAAAAPGATDDATIARAAGVEVGLVAGDERSFKLTYPSDFARAEGFLATRLVSRTGMGFDVHAFEGPGPLVIGGIEVPHDRGLTGHSDADVALHALTDAILGAIANGDIGSHFPPSDARWRGAASRLFLEHARDLVTERGGIIDHVDVTIICEAPKIGPHRDAMRQSIAGILNLRNGQVSVKATTTERLGFTGRGEGIAAQAVATVRCEYDA
jgi:2-C-methyl-D-erythritol 4-phosphate cytidylyltransferase/2-C-methyl-D-erythritol 2,4-cyclodiphosphate synthase